MFKLICSFAWDEKREYAMTKLLSRKTAPECTLAIVWSASLLRQVLIFIKPSESYLDNKLYRVNKNFVSALNTIVL